MYRILRLVPTETAFFVLLTSLVLLPGCGGTPPTKATPTKDPPTPMTLTVACPSGTPARAVEAVARTNASRGGPTIRVVTYEGNLDPSTQAADLWLIRPSALPNLVEADLLSPLPAADLQRGSLARWDEILPIWTERLLKWKSTPYGLPVTGESPLLFSRTDLFLDAKHREAFRKAKGRDLTPPTTWEDLAEIAEYFRDQDPEKSPSLPPRPEGDDALVSEFSLLAASSAVRAVRIADRANYSDPQLFSFHYDLKTGMPRWNTAGFAYALTLFQRLDACRPPRADASPPETFARAKAVFCVADLSWIERFQKAKARPPFTISRLPGIRSLIEENGTLRTVANGNFVPHLGETGSLGVVPRASSQQEAAFGLLRQLSGEEASRRMLLDPTQTSGPFRQGHFEARGWSAFGLDQNQTNTLVNALRDTLAYPGLANPTTCLRLPQSREHSAALSAELRAVLEKGKDPKAALNAVTETWSATDAKLGLGRIRADYAHALGLPPP